MSRILTVLVLSLGVTGSALACEGEHTGAKGEHCNMPTTTTAATELPAGTRASLDVTGMTCGACAEKVKTALLGVEGVNGATVDATTGKAEVSYDAGKTSPEKILAGVATTGHFTAALASK